MGSRRIQQAEPGTPHIYTMPGTYQQARLVQLAVLWGWTRSGIVGGQSRKFKSAAAPSPISKSKKL